MLIFEPESVRIPFFPHWKRLALLALVSGLGFSATAQTVLLDFDAVGQYTNNFNPWNDTGGANGGNYAFAENTGAGTGGGGGVSVFQSTDTTAIYKNGSWDFSTNGSTIVLSVLVRANNLSSGNKLQLGILNTNANGLNGNAGVSFASFRFIPNAGPVWSLREQYRTNNVTAPEVVLGNVNVVAGRWYKFQVSFTNTSGPSGNYDAACALYDYGVDGRTPGTNLVTFATLQTHLGQDIAQDSTVWTGLRAYQDAGVDAWDNFLVYRANSRPGFTLGLTNRTIAAGSIVTFGVLADGPGVISYSWYTNGVPVAGATGANYTSPALTTAYTSIMAVAANSNGSTTNQATLTVAAMAPITLIGFNRDMVVENSAAGPPYGAAALEFNPNESTAFYQAGLPGKNFGLPASGQFASVVDGTVFQFQPYTTSNALVLSSGTGLTFGTLTLGTQVTYSKIAVLANSGGGGGTPNLTLRFLDDSTLVVPYNAQDWFFNTGFALQGVERINLTSGATTGAPNDPRFYQTTLDLAVLMGPSNKPLAGITFDKAAGAGATAVYAVSGLPITGVSLAAISNASATSIQATTATIGGQVVSTGGETPSVTLFYGTADGGTNAANWAQSVVIGFQAGTFSRGLTGLTPNTTYYFASRAINTAGTVWATPAKLFTTLALTLSALTNLPAGNIQANLATLNGEVLSTGGDAPVVRLFYGAADGGTNPVAWAQSLDLGLQTGLYSTTAFGLSSNSTYYYSSRGSNAAGTSWATPSRSFTTLATNPVLTGVAMLTYRYDNARLGVNTNETRLTHANVNTNSFGRIFSYDVDGYVYAQPLVLTNVNIPGKGVHNVVYVVTEHESVYAFDADSASGPNASPLWQTSFLGPGVTTVPSGDVGTGDITPEIGITSTPVIDPATGTIYVEAKTKEGTSYVHRLHALDTATGLERTNYNSPVLISATNYIGTGTGAGDNDGNGHILWNPRRHMNRVALALHRGILYIAFASHGDNDPYHGWLFSYNPTNLVQTGVYNSTPYGTRGGFWQGGGGPTFDPEGNMYLMTGNGSFDATGATFNAASNNFAMAVMKFTTSNGYPVLVDYFAPFNQASLSGADSDLGSGAPIVLPDSAGSLAHPRLLVAAGKSGKIYLLDRDNMGRFRATDDNQIVQVLNGLAPGGQNGSYATPAFFNNTLYYIGMNDTLRAFPFSGGLISTAPPTQGSTVFGTKGSTSPTVSAHGISNAIVWAIQSDGQTPTTAAVLRAYNATNVAQELYNSSQLLSRDNPGLSVKFTTPTVVNGKVYVGAQYKLSVFGTGAFLATPVITPNGGTFTGSVAVAISEATPGASLFYTLDTTDPTTNSIPYTGPFVLTNSTLVKARAFAPGAADSGIASATFINSATIGSGIGLLGAYYSNQLMTLIEPPTLVRTDAVVNFNWGTGSPDPSISSNSFTARWTGSVQPQFSETYTFYTTTDDGVRLWVNDQLLIDHWANQSAIEWSGTIQLLAQQRYNIRMEYFENGGDAAAMLAWGSPSTTKAIIPQTQLYPVSNPPPVVVLTTPTNTATFTATASVTLGASADAPYNPIARVDFYANTTLLGTVSNSPYLLTTTGLGAGSYALKAVAWDPTGLGGTSAPVNITVTAGTGQPYGLASRSPVAPYLSMPYRITGTLPTVLSQTGAFTNTPNMWAAPGLIPYTVNVPLWSDAAGKTRWMSVPNNGAPYTIDEQVGYAPNGEWSFPGGTVFVKHFELVTNEITGASKRLETRLLVRNPDGQVYGVTYKWRANNTDADLLATSLSEDITITNASGVRTQTWYYPSPSDCLACHTPSAGYVLGVKTRQLNGNFDYPASAQTDNQLRTLNRLGLLYPAIDEALIPGLTQLVSVTNLAAPLADRARSYLDANCAQCHRPGGPGPTFDARYDTPLTNQNIINALLQKGDLGFDNARVVVPKDIWRSILYQRSISLDASVKMPPLARNLVDTQNMAMIADWINGLAGTPALPPPAIVPAGGTFNGSVSVAFQHPDPSAALYYTLDGSLPSTNSLLYSTPLQLSNSVTVRVNAARAGYSTSVATSGQFNIVPSLFFVSQGFSTNGSFQVQVSGATGRTYVLQASTNLLTWVPVNTNTPIANPFSLVDPSAAAFPMRFYRAVLLP